MRISTTKRIQVLDITDLVEREIAPGARGVIVYTPHTTAAITINEYEPRLARDMERFYGMLAQGEWEHDLIDNNAYAHLLSSLIKPSVVIPVREGRLLLGTWQRVLFVELDGPRTRTIFIQNL
ncbi:MAG: YjbQ family protein [Candidatus Micrarchaeota archaeon]|nr:YjbQ family protein [Candidatus Micrarchaeota archaeon]